jgi:hypothetical protein
MLQMTPLLSILFFLFLTQFEDTWYMLALKIIAFINIYVSLIYFWR